MFTPILPSLMDIDAAAEIADVIVNFDRSGDELTAIDIECRGDVPKKVVRHAAMSAQQQQARIDEIEQTLKAFGPTKSPLPPPHGSKKRKTITPEPSPTTVTDTTMKLATPPAEEVSEKSSNDTQSISKHPKPTKKQRENDALFTNLPPKIVKLMRMLNNFGSPFEKVLSNAVRDAIVELSRMPDTEKLVAELQAMEREWKLANRASLQKVEALLSRNGIVAIGGVEIPAGTL